MAARLKMVEIRTFIKNVRIDHKTKSDKITKKEKRKCWGRMISTLFKMLWSGISAPFIYPIWYALRKSITEKIYFGTTWQEVRQLMRVNETEFAKQKLKANGKFLYWLWTYGDADDPLGNGGMPNWYGKNVFWNRWRWSAFRNPRFNINYMDFRTGRIIDVVTIIDNRNFHTMHVSHGIGDSADGIYFKWMKDNNNKWYFIYEDNNSSNLWYFGYTGLLHEDIGKSGGRFETSYRKTERTYYKP